MTAAGMLLAIGLTSVPYSLNLRTRLKQSAGAFLQPAKTAAPVAEPPKPAPPAFDVAAWYIGRGAEPEKHGVLIESMDGSRVYAAHNPDNLFNPASLIKLATSLAALRKLGADYRFQTKVFADGTVDSTGTLKGTLYVAGDDPTFGDIAASMIARELNARGIKRVSEGIKVSPNFCFNYSDKPDESAARLARAMKLSDERKVGVSEQAAGDLWFTFQSYPLREILLYMNAHSSNFVAERVGGLVGGPDGIGRLLVEELKLPREQVRIQTASGLEFNRLTPRGFVAVIRALHDEAKRQGMELEDVMAVASNDWGTLRRRMTGTPLEGATVGKTGTLAHDDGGMTSLGGVVYTQQAGMVVFVFFDQGKLISENRQLEEQLLAEVIAAHDTPRSIAQPTPRHLLPRESLRIEPQVGAEKGEVKKQ